MRYIITCHEMCSNFEGKMTYMHFHHIKPFFSMSQSKKTTYLDADINVKNYLACF